MRPRRPTPSLSRRRVRPDQTDGSHVAAEKPGFHGDKQQPHRPLDAKPCRPQDFSDTSHAPAYDHAGNLVDDGQLIYRYDAWNRLVKVRAKQDDVTIQTAAYDGTGRRIKKVVDTRGDLDGTEVYYYDGWKVVEIRNGSGTEMDRQFIHGTQYIDEHIMMRAKNKGDLYIHQGEQSERERAATGKAGRDARVRPATCPKNASTKRAAGGANWNVIATTDLGGNVMERYVYEPYGSLTVNQSTSWGDRDGDGDVDATDKGTVGTTCTGTVSGECRILDLDFDGDYDNDDEAAFDNLRLGAARREGGIASLLGLHVAHQGLHYEPETRVYQNRARNYKAEQRRFLQRDPANYVDGLAIYVPVLRNPLRYGDPMGLRATRIESTPGAYVIYFPMLLFGEDASNELASWAASQIGAFWGAGADLLGEVKV